MLPLGVVSLVGGESFQSLASHVLVSALCGLGCGFDSYIVLKTVHWNIMAMVVAQSANRALGLLIANSKALGGMPYDIYTK